MANILGLGIDIVDLERIRKAYERHGATFALRICTVDEWAYCARHADPIASLAARFSAKEATAKALGTGIGEYASFTEIEVIRSESGAPALKLHGNAAQTAQARGISAWQISLTHSQNAAAATVIALGD